MGVCGPSPSLAGRSSGGCDPDGPRWYWGLRPQPRSTDPSGRVCPAVRLPSAILVGPASGPADAAFYGFVDRLGHEHRLMAQTLKDPRPDLIGGFPNEPDRP